MLCKVLLFQGIKFHKIVFELTQQFVSMRPEMLDCLTTPDGADNIQFPQSLKYE